MRSTSVVAKSTSLWLGFLWLLALAAVAPAADTADSAGSDDLLGALEWREIGPYRGGRSAAVAGIPAQRDVYYFGATGGGVWKTTDGGQHWHNVSDGFFGGSIGAVAASEWDPNVIYVGGGEKTVRGNVSHGDGMWKSTDAGASWRHIGLADSRHIPRVRIHPKNADHAYAAVLGHLFGPSSERGVFRTTDGGDSWQRILQVNDEVGAVDLAMDPTNPRILYATMWRVLRTPWSLESGGDGSGLWKSTDSGETWTDLSSQEGFPAGPLGIIGITVSPTDPQNLYAIVEAEDGGVFRSRDGGDTWERTNEERQLRQRAWYYTRIYADPADAESVYVTNVRFHRSKDGGRTFVEIPTPHGDNHDLWIDPGDPLRMIEANDGGATISYDGGRSWSTQANQPTAQMYRVSVDDDFPYRLLGGQQDNSAIRIRSRSAFADAIGTRDWQPTAGGESGHIVAKPGEPDRVYGGSYGGYLTWFDHRTGERQAVNVWPDDPMGWGAAELTYRFQWNFPIFFSPHDPEVLYAAANVLFKSGDGGRSWQAISDDLTRNDKTKMGPSGGPITKDNTSVEYYGTIFAAAESPHEPGVLWAGSDDGLIHLSRDGGATWSDVTPAALPELSQINSLDVHPFEKGGIYVAATRYKLDDFAPYLYRSPDYGQTWTKITSGIADDHFTRALRADPDRPGLLYAGTERGVYLSFDDGGSWQSLQRQLPIVPITDLAIKEHDLVAATQGRGYWILDDLWLLHQLRPEIAKEPVFMAAPGPTYRLPGGRDDEPVHMGKNPADGVVFYYWLAQAPATDTEVALEILEQDGDLIRRFARQADDDEEEAEEDERQVEDPRQLTVEQGMNRFVWDTRYSQAERFSDLVLWNRRLDGPRAVPGRYRARLQVGDLLQEAEFEILPDPRSTATPEGFQAQFDFLIETRDKLGRAHREIARIRDVRQQLDDLENRLGDDDSEELKAALVALREKLQAVEEALYQTKNRSPQDPLNFPVRLNDKLAGLLGLAGFGDQPPTAQMVAVKDQLVAAIDVELGKLETLWAEDLRAFNEMAKEHALSAVLLKESEP